MTVPIFNDHRGYTHHIYTYPIWRNDFFFLLTQSNNEYCNYTNIQETLVHIIKIVMWQNNTKNGSIFQCSNRNEFIEHQQNEEKIKQPKAKIF